MTSIDATLPDFGSLTLNEKENGWGPVDIPEEFKKMPYQPFSKDARLGRVADWSGNVYQDLKAKARYASQFSGSQYAYYHDEDDTDFQLVSSGRDNKMNTARQRYRFPMRGRRGPGSYNNNRGNYQNMNRKIRNAADRDRFMQQNRRWNQWGYGLNQRRGNAWRTNTGAWGGDRRHTHRTNRDASIQIKDTWEVLEELDFGRLSKLALPNLNPPEDLVDCGEMEYYDKSYDFIGTRTERELVRVNRIHHTVTTTSDPVIKRLAKDNIGKVYCTDSIAAIIMCCTRSVYPWDLIVTRIEDRLFIDEREKVVIDMMSVCETATEPPNEEITSINSPQRLALEATYINTNLSQQMLLMGGKKYAFPEPNPFVDDDSDEEDSSDSSEVNQQDKKNKELCSIGYRYRLFDLGGGIQMVARCEVNGVLPPVNEDYSTDPQFMVIRALNEFDPRFCNGVDWRKKMDTQRGAVLASEIKNNAFKLSRWTTCSILAGADHLKLGFVSRANPRDSSRHVVLGTQNFSPPEFASQLNLKMDNAWGILRCVVDFFMNLPPGKYLLMKDPNKPLLRAYSIPKDAFDSDGEDVSGEDSNVASDKPAQEPIKEESEAKSDAANI